MHYSIRLARALHSAGYRGLLTVTAAAMQADRVLRELPPGMFLLEDIHHHPGATWTHTDGTAVTLGFTYDPDLPPGELIVGQDGIAISHKITHLMF